VVARMPPALHSHGADAQPIVISMRDESSAKSLPSHLDDLIMERTWPRWLQVEDVVKADRGFLSGHSPVASVLGRPGLRAQPLRRTKPRQDASCYPAQSCCPWRRVRADKRQGGERDYRARRVLHYPDSGGVPILTASEEAALIGCAVSSL
jgi:hypothetical protein